MAVIRVVVDIEANPPSDNVPHVITWALMTLLEEAGQEYKIVYAQAEEVHE